MVYWKPNALPRSAAAPSQGGPVPETTSDAVTWRTASPGISVVTLQRPPANALGVPLLNGMHAAIDAAEKAGDVKVMVVASSLAGFFAAGADIKHLSTIDAESFTAYGDQMRAVNDRLAAAQWISIAAVNGLALGGGLELAMSCTMRVSGPDARFGLPEVKIGLIPGAGGTQRLPRLVGRGRALDIMLTGRQVPATEAAQIGLVDRLTSGDAESAALDLAKELVGASLPAQLAVVRTVDASFDLSLPDGMDREVREEQGLFETGEAAEGISAFVEKRAPKFA
jgi:enoyl-CoA hydratase